MYELLIGDIASRRVTAVSGCGRGVVSRVTNACGKIPGTDPHGLTGAAIWYEDARARYRTVLLTLLHAAVRAVPRSPTTPRSAGCSARSRR
jgi:hypothetical protein